MTINSYVIFTKASKGVCVVYMSAVEFHSKKELHSSKKKKVHHKSPTANSFFAQMPHHEHKQNVDIHRQTGRIHNIK